MGEHSTLVGICLAAGCIAWSFVLPPDRGDIADTLRALAVPIFVALFLWEDKA
jgi:hypothetical protein